MVRVAASRSDTDLNVSSSVRDDEHVPFTMNRAVCRLQRRRQVIADSGGCQRTRQIISGGSEMSQMVFI